MAGMFDQFEQVAQKSKNNNTWNTQQGFIQMKLEQDVPIFSRTKMNFTPSDKITHVAVCSNQLVVATNNSRLFRMNLLQPDQQDEIILSKYTNTSRLSNLFLDPIGNHLLLSFSARPPANYPELVYLNRKSTKLRPTTKFRNQEITEVAWNMYNESDSTTGSILLGTSKGLIFETEIMIEGDKFFTSGFSSSLEQYWRQLPNYLPLYGNKEIEGLVFDIGKGTNIPITGLEYYQILGTQTYAVFAATPTRLYYFSGTANPEEKPLLQQVFNRYLNIPEIETYEETKSALRYSRLKFWSDNIVCPHAFAWLVEKGINYCELISDGSDDVGSIKNNLQLISYPKPLYEDYSVSEKPPFTCALTKFHILLAYSDKIKAVSLLNKEVVYEDNYNEAFGRLINITKDPVCGTIWAGTENAVFRFRVTKEERNVWQIYCENKNFDLAKKYSRDNPVHYSYVLVKEADMLFDKGEYIASAQRYAETHSGFEEVCLKFIQADQQDALKVFLRRKLETLTPHEKTQISLIVIWLVELYLNRLEEIRIAGLEQSSKYFELQKEFQALLAMPKVADNIKANKNTIYDLMASHGDKMNSIQLTIVHKDFEQLIRQHIYKNSFHEALDVLKSQNNKDLFYYFAPILIQEIPKHTVKALIDQGPNLVPVKLLPALVSCDGEPHSKEIIKYLEFCVDSLKSIESSIHNLLVSLYIKYDPDKFMIYLEKQGQDISLVNYNVHFALRLCQEANLISACVQLSALLGLWESAVDLALTIDIEMAKQYANMPPQSDVELRKKLWLKIAQNVVSGKDNIEQAMMFLKDCDLLRIENILPFFSDFVTIDHFKDAICKSLKEYNQHIQDLKEEMEDATQSAELVRQEIQNFRNRCTFITTSDTCEICNNILIIRPFYLFPCQHKFHNDCLLKELNSMLGPAKKNKLADLQRQLKLLSTQSNADAVSTSSAGISAKDAVKAEIDNIVASECLFCGENMIRNIDMPFIHEKEYDKIMKEWE